MPDVFVAGCDLSGPYACGNHERLKKVRYCLHVVVTVLRLAADILKREYEEYEPSEVDEAPDAASLDVDREAIAVSALRKPSEGDDQEAVLERWEVPEVGLEEEEDEPSGENEEAGDVYERKDFETPCEAEAPLRRVPMLEVPYAVMLPDKKGKTVVNAFKEVLADIAYWGIPVYRVHSDKAAELTNSHWKQFLADQKIRRTTTVGSDFRANGRTESHIRRAKGLTRGLLASSECPDEDWAFAMRHAVYTMRMQSFATLGLPQRELVPFYTQVWVRKKEWTLHLWAPRCLEARVMAPSESAPNGYVARLKPDHPSDVSDGIQRIL